MIYKPYNVEPHNTCIDAAVSNSFRFIFSGDSLTYVDYCFYDCSTNNVVSKAFVPLEVKNTYNNESFGVGIRANTFTNGKSYKYKMNLYQRKHDIFAVQGTVRSMPETLLSETDIPINYGITEIENPIKYTIDGVETIFGCCYMEINNGTICERRMITNYDTSIKWGNDDGYGNFDYRTYVTVSAPFSVKPTEGTTYRIYKNYITTPEYYFECCKTPVILPKAELTDQLNILCTSEYYQEQDIPVKNYQYSLYKSVEDKVVLETTVVDNNSNSPTTIYVANAKSEIVQLYYNAYITISYTIDGDVYTQTRIVDNANYDSNFITTKEPFNFTPSDGMTVKVFYGSSQLISQSPVIYNGSLEYKFTDILRDVGYKVVLKVTTQKNTIVENEISGMFQSVVTTDSEPYNFKYEIDYETNSIRLFFDNKCALEREDVITHEVRRIVSGAGVPTVKEQDVLVASNHQYRYTLTSSIPTDTGYQYGLQVVSDIIAPVWCDWKIYGITPQGEISSWNGYYNTAIGVEDPNRKPYKVDEIWSFDINVEESDITQNINRETYTGYYSKPKVVMNENNYISGSLSCDITKLNSVTHQLTDDFYKVAEWRRFISSYELYILKNPKGDMWVISITDNPTSKYDYTSKLKRTNVSFSFVETMDINDITI